MRERTQQFCEWEAKGLIVYFFRSTRQATPPKDAEKTKGEEKATIDAMAIGNSGYATPWGVWLDQHGQYWLHPKYAVRKRPAGTFQMRVERREDGFHVWAPAEAKYSPQETPSYVSPADTQYILVVEFHRR